jgi:hypothetical protein
MSFPLLLWGCSAVRRQIVHTQLATDTSFATTARAKNSIFHGKNAVLSPIGSSAPRKSARKSCVVSES